jgi:hypothetical protein
MCNFFAFYLLLIGLVHVYFYTPLPLYNFPAPFSLPFASLIHNMPQQLEKHQTQNLRLRNPTSYHLMATGQLPPTHPLSDVHSNNNRDSPTSETLDFHEAFIMNSFNQQEYEEDNNSEYPVYGRSESFGSTGPTVVSTSRVRYTAHTQKRLM